MDYEFRYETDLVDTFIDNYSNFSSNIIVRELPIRNGNIDIVNIENNNLPFNNEQIHVLTIPSCALTFMRIKNKRPISRKTLNENIGLSESTLDNALQLLMKVNLIYKTQNNNYLRTKSFEFPKTIIYGYEAKLNDFNKAFYQGVLNKKFVDYSYLVFPLEKANRLISKKQSILVENGIGLIGVSDCFSVRLIRAKKTDGLKSHIRLLNITKTITKANNI